MHRNVQNVFHFHGTNDCTCSSRNFLASRGKFQRGSRSKGNRKFSRKDFVYERCSPFDQSKARRHSRRFVGYKSIDRRPRCTRVIGAWLFALDSPGTKINAFRLVFTYEGRSYATLGPLSRRARRFPTISCLRRPSRLFNIHL